MMPGATASAVVATEHSDPVPVRPVTVHGTVNSNGTSVRVVLSVRPEPFRRSVRRRVARTSSSPS